MSQTLAEIKKSGFIPQAQRGLFCLRLKVVGGNLDSGKLQAIVGVAEKYGKGQVHLTSRQGVEIPSIRIEDTAKVIQALAEAGVEPGCTGAGVRTITACQGNAVCGSGLIDCGELARRIDEDFSHVELPHKFKVGITGCMNNCLRVEANDIGIKGALLPSWTADECVYCGVCQKVCRPGAIRVQKKTGLEYLEAACVNCGRCGKNCPRGCWTGPAGYKVFFGGVFGNEIHTGRQLLPVLSSTSQVLQAVGVALAFFEEHGRKKERFVFTLDRVGWDKLTSQLTGAGLPAL